MASLLEKPQLGPLQVNLRPYQEEAIGAIRNEFAAGRKSTLLVLPTGLGKTLTFGMIARKTIERGNRVLVLAHRLELVEQAAQKLDLLGVTAEVEMADSYAKSRFDEPDCVVGSIQSLQRRRLQSWDPSYFSLIIVDEAHHAVAGTYQSIFRHFSRARRLGVTATADRADKVGLGSVFDSVAYEVKLWDAMTAPEPGPYLCRLTFCQRDIQIDLRQLRTKNGDYSDADLERVLGPMVEVLANAIRQEIGERRTIVFTPGVKSAEGLASALKSLGIRADSISGSDAGRKDKVEQFKDGRLQVLVNCAVLTEGFDAPETSAVVLCRPTKSRSLYAQMVGRGTRLSAGKENCLVLDFDFLTAKHDLVKPADLLGLPPKLAKEASQSMAKNEQLDLLDSVAKARTEFERKEKLRIKAEERKITYRFANTFDPLEYSKVVIGQDYVPPANASTRMASEKQQALLAKFGLNPNMTRDQANYYIGHQMKRIEKGLCTPKQIKVLLRNGFDPAEARSMTKSEAGAHIDRIFGNTQRA